MPDGDNNGNLGRVDKALARVRRRRTGRIALRVVVSVLGAVTIVIGLLLVPLPGPGWLIVFAGLAIWSIEFHWARRLNRFVRDQVARWARWYARQGWPVRIIVGLLTLVVVIAVVLGAAYLSIGPEIFDRFL